MNTAELKTRPAQAAPPKLPRNPMELPNVEAEYQKLAVVNGKLVEATQRFNAAREAYKAARKASGSRAELEDRAKAVLDGGTIVDAKTVVAEFNAAMEEVRVLEEAKKIQGERYTAVEQQGWRQIRTGLLPEWMRYIDRVVAAGNALVVAQKEARMFLVGIEFGEPLYPIETPYLNALGPYLSELASFANRNRPKSPAGGGLQR